MKARKLVCSRILFGSYRVDQYADPEIFKQSIDRLFDQYPVEVVEYVTSPDTGIQRQRFAPPPIATIVEALDGHMAYLEKVAEAVRLGKRGITKREYVPKPYIARERGPGHFANVFVPETSNLYADFTERAKTAEQTDYRYEISNGRTGIMVPRSWFDELRVAAIASTWTPPSTAEINDYYAKHGSSHLVANMFARERSRAAIRPLGEGQQT